MRRKSLTKAKKRFRSQADRLQAWASHGRLLVFRFDYSGLGRKCAGWWCPWERSHAYARAKKFKKIVNTPTTTDEAGSRMYLEYFGSQRLAIQLADNRLGQFIADDDFIDPFMLANLRI